MIKKILIANRGEIAIRIANTCRKMGIQSVGVFSQDDASSLHLDYCDERFFIGSDPLKGSYLNIEKIIEISKENSVDAIHPGYGFLSENAVFVNKLEREKIAFIGPSSKAIELMGDKIESKKIAKKAGVNCIPGYEEAITDIKQGIKFSKDIGFPVMIKASAGGGGKGMRIAHRLEEFEELVIAAKNEARNAFGDDRVFIEKYIEKPRHIEIQILGDKFGNIVWLGERECSIQRRHQKIIEEAPSSFLDQDTRSKMGNQAVKLAREVQYYSAGTVEFVVNPNKEFYFLEMNTRLQVEHPVTETVTGIDLVEQMIDIADNKNLKVKQDDIVVKGWSFESRLCGESPIKNFLPSAGRIKEISFPKENIRVDSGYQAGGEVSIYYDSLLAKIISKGNTRQDAINVMQKALQEVCVDGIDTNIDFLMDIFKNKNFIKGNINTNFIEEVYRDGYKAETSNKDELEVIAIFAFCYHIDYLISVNKDIKNIIKEWMLYLPHKKINIKFISFQNNKLKILFEKTVKEIKYDINYITSLIKVSFNKKIFLGRVAPNKKFIKVFYNGSNTEVRILSLIADHYNQKLPEEKKKDTSKEVLSPMPGKVTNILVQENDKVEIGDSLIILDAMKMENIIKSDCSAVIKNIHIKKNDSVSADQLLITFN
jgi:propionyl-CoA carboxylase alpha chain